MDCAKQCNSFSTAVALDGNLFGGLWGERGKAEGEKEVVTQTKNRDGGPSSRTRA